MLALTVGIKTQGKKYVNLDLSTPLQLIGRSLEFQRIVEVLAQDGDLLITGVPGSGRRTLVRTAAQEVGAIVLEIDCIRATDGDRFIQLLAEAISQNWQATAIQDWVNNFGNEFFIYHPERKLKLLRSLNQKQQWQAFEILLNLLQIMAVNLNQRVVLILQSFPHIRSWDRNGLWEGTFRREINVHTHVSYVLVATIAESSHHTDETNYPLETIQLAPLPREVLALWARETLHTQGLKFDSRSQALQLFLDAVQGHIGDAMAIIRRLQTFSGNDALISEFAVQQAIEGLLKDLSLTFESLVMLLPANQLHLLESLALDPTDKPQSKEYIQKHGLSRGGSLQGSLIGLQHKGLIYNAEHGYRLALPLLALWLRHKLS
ncbi:ATP-binding protein [Nostoc sp. FACHB-87]|uniref:ATP-binding protein n=1 Tax=Nostocales TaxID=1161 RepID=UPI0016899BE7|nr:MULTISPECIES: ATP-binding protein [Nostocales]MBD2456711.1 ATP-binding protein [Nostoc sp. FACHB-87]MBD2478034.1 ATP-binding protein [Anabaena sp. FACHB-83]MBD2490879.1 ATP-binding protein [Aulosira sp. FACHB-615]